MHTQPSNRLKRAELQSSKIGVLGRGYTSLRTIVAANARNGKRSFVAAPALPVDAVAVKGRNTRCMYFRCKRAIDVILACWLLVVLFPLMLVIAVLIKLESPGTVLFVQHRVGARRRIKGGRLVWLVRTFAFYKFRSMIQNADQSVHEAYFRDFREGRADGNGNGARFKLNNDSRTTRLGRILRKTSLDELPQLVNVIKGDMSLVGPRPALPYEVAMYDDAHFERLCAVPGITGFWQARARCEVSFEQMVRMDIEYTRHCTLWLDIKLLLLTIPAVLSCRGAT